MFKAIRLLLLRLVAVSCLAMPGISARADTSWPQRPVTLLVGFAAGGATDGMARLYAQKLTEILGVQVLVDNRPGAAQLVAIRALRNAAPDGYVLYMGTGSSLAQGPGMRKDLPYDPLKDFTLIDMVATSPGIVIVNPAVPAKTLGELLDYAAKNPDQLNYGSAGIGTANHLQTAYLMARTGIRLNHVPYKSDSEVVREVVAGRLQMSISTAQVAMPMITAGRVRALAVTSVKPLSFVPGVPTLGEGGVKGIEGLDPFTFYGVVGPAHMPAELVSRLSSAFNDISKMPDVVEKMRTTLFAEPSIGTAATFRSFMEGEVAKWGEVGKSVKLTE